MKTYLVLFLCIVGVPGKEWDAFDKTHDNLKSYNKAAEDVIALLETIIKNSTAEALTFWSGIEELPFLREGKTLVEGDECKMKLNSIKELKSFFRLTFTELEEPILKRISDIKGRMLEVMSTLAVYRGLANMKAMKCSREDTKCKEDLQLWLHGSIEDVICKIVPNCRNHTISKRYVRGRYCSKDSFQCSNRDCISYSYVCDGSCNCYPCDDEPSGCSRFCFGGFHCDNLRCIEKNKICNGIDDCGDGSDEEICHQKSKLESASWNCSVDNGGFLCDNKNCLKLSQVCDGVDQCGDRSDEGSQCGKPECSAGCLAGGGVCFATPRGSVCLSKCPSGTSETPLGCLPGPTLPPATLSELIEDVPRLSTRYMSSFHLLQRRVIDQLSKSLANFLDCENGSNYSIGKLSRLSKQMLPSSQPATLGTTTPTATIVEATSLQEDEYAYVDDS